MNVMSRHIRKVELKNEYSCAHCDAIIVSIYLTVIFNDPNELLVILDVSGICYRVYL